MQTYKDIAVIIVDDCSKESCNEILLKYDKLLNINYVRLSENHGSGYARNIGIDNSGGEYILFADSDDTFLNAFAIEKMIEDIKSGDYDFCSYGFVQECDDLKFSAGQCNATWIWCKLYKRKLFNKWNLRFSNERFNEDVAFNQICHALTDKIYKSNDTFYLHHANENSITKTNEYKTDDMNSFARNYIKAFNFVSSKVELSDKICWQFVDGFIILYHFYTEMLRTKEQKYCEEFYECIKQYYNTIFDFAHVLICSDDFDEHYFRIFNSHGIHKKKLICTLDWYTFINDCEKSRRELEKGLIENRI